MKPLDLHKFSNIGYTGNKLGPENFSFTKQFVKHLLHL